VGFLSTALRQSFPTDSQLPAVPPFFPPLTASRPSPDPLRFNHVLSWAPFSSLFETDAQGSISSSARLILLPRNRSDFSPQIEFGPAELTAGPLFATRTSNPSPSRSANFRDKFSFPFFPNFFFSGVLRQVPSEHCFWTEDQASSRPLRQVLFAASAFSVSFFFLFGVFFFFFFFLFFFGPYPAQCSDMFRDSF